MSSIDISIHVSRFDNRVFLIKENVRIGFVDEFGHVVTFRRLHSALFHRAIVASIPAAVGGISYHSSVVSTFHCGANVTHNGNQHVHIVTDIKQVGALNHATILVPFSTLTIKTSRLESFQTNDKGVAKITPAENIMHLLTRVVGYALVATAETLDGTRSALITHKVNKSNFPRSPALRSAAG